MSLRRQIAGSSSQSTLSIFQHLSVEMMGFTGTVSPENLAEKAALLSAEAETTMHAFSKSKKAISCVDVKDIPAESDAKLAREFVNHLTVNREKLNAFVTKLTKQKNAAEAKYNPESVTLCKPFPQVLGSKEIDIAVEIATSYFSGGRKDIKDDNMLEEVVLSGIYKQIFSADDSAKAFTSLADSKAAAPTMSDRPKPH